MTNGKHRPHAERDAMFDKRTTDVLNEEDSRRKAASLKTQRLRELRLAKEAAERKAAKKGEEAASAHEPPPHTAGTREGSR
jgi:hypothetical protein